MKYDLLSQNKDGVNYLNSILEYIKDKQRYNDDISAGKKLRRKEPQAPNMEEFTNKPTEIYFAMKEIELLGINITPLFREYEPLRCLKCNCDISMLKEYELDNISISDRVLMIIPTILELKHSKAGNDYYKLHFVDDYGSNKYSYLWLKEYNKFKNNIVIGEPSILQLDIKQGNCTIKFIRILKNIPTQLIENIKFDTRGDENRILTKLLYDYITGDTEVWFNHFKAPFHITLSYKLLKQLRNDGYKFELNHIDKPIEFTEVNDNEDIICEECNKYYYNCKCS